MWGVFECCFIFCDMDPHSHFVVGTPAHTFWHDFKYYVSVQALIWIKTIILFLWIGMGVSYRGQPLLLSIPFVALPYYQSNLLFLVDFLFHQLMHVAIALWVFLLAKHMKEFKPFSIAKLFVVAVFLHNISYWLTRSHVSLAYSLKDVLTDYLALWMFLFFFMFVLRFFPQLRKWHIPFIEKKQVV